MRWTASYQAKLNWKMKEPPIFSHLRSEKTKNTRWIYWMNESRLIQIFYPELLFEIFKTQNALSKTTFWIARFNNILFLMNSAVSLLFSSFLSTAAMFLLLRIDHFICFCFVFIESTCTQLWMIHIEQQPHHHHHIQNTCPKC